MRQISLLVVIILTLLAINTTTLSAQSLRVSLSPDKSKVDRSTTNGTATVFFDSNIEDLRIICTEEKPDEPIQKIGNKLWFTHIDVKADMESDGLCYRNYLLKSASSPEYYLTTPEIGYNQVLYYTVVLPNIFPTSLTMEYLFTKTAKHGIRISYGKRVGGYIGYKWGDYKASGVNIEMISNDFDVTNATLMGGIRTSLTGGLRIGLFHKNINSRHYALYLLAGGGYGEYGRQWENQYLVEDSTFFYSDYIKGFTGEVAVQFTVLHWLCFSAGADMVIGNGKVSTDYQIGLGINLYMSK